MYARLLVCLGFVCVVRASAADWSSLYGAAVLAREQTRLQHLAEDVSANEIGTYLTDGQRLLFGPPPIDLPLKTDSASPINCDLHRNGTIVLPALTLLFVEDLAKAYAWLWANHYSSETVDEYTSMLRFRNIADFPESKYPAPLTALHIPADALNEADVKKMFLRLRTSAYMFLILHQMGQLRSSGETSEEQTDLFTLDLMKRNSETPLGLLLLMDAGVYLPDGQHPITAKRLIWMADYLDRRVQDFVEGRPDRLLARNAIHAIARSLRVSAASVQDSSTQSAWAEQARRTDVSSLLPKRQADRGTAMPLH